MRILLDMNLSPQWIDFLAKYNCEADHWSKFGSANTPDSDIMAFAKNNNYVILTHDLDFGIILALTHGDKPSVIQLRKGDLFLGSSAQLVAAALETYRQELDNGALLTIDAVKTRIRILPFSWDT